ncbi:MAG: hypothetical protein SV375_14730, partial [Thermodesulfobacteriota bacterium]|nr:hypothetical protein [Thermodesulfobacteriota bacterium]
MLLCGACSIVQGPEKKPALEKSPPSHEDGPFFIPEKGREPPRKLPVNRPVQITFDVDPVLYAAVSKDGRWLIHSSNHDEFSRLRLRSADPNNVLLPKTLTLDAGVQSSPTISTDGRWVAFVGTGYDVKGDIYLMELMGQDASPRRLTGRDTKDRSPCFSPDGKRLYFHQVRPGQDHRQLVYLDTDQKNPKPRPLEIGGDGAFPSISPDGKQCVFVSVREDPKGDIFLLHLEEGRVVKLTSGPDQDLLPVWSWDGRYIYFTRFNLDTDRDGSVTPKDNAVICRLRVKDPEPLAYPVTSAAYSAYQPIVTESLLYFLSNRRGVSNLWALPLEGEIPPMENAKAQFDLARELSELAPPNHHLAVLGYYKVLERFFEHKPIGARASYSMGKVYKRIGMLDGADLAFHIVSKYFSETMPEAGLARIGRIGIRARRQCNQAHTDGQRQGIIMKAFSELEAIVARHPDRPGVQARSRIEQAGLLAQFGEGSG